MVLPKRQIVAVSSQHGVSCGENAQAAPVGFSSKATEVLKI